MSLKPVLVPLNIGLLPTSSLYTQANREKSVFPFNYDSGNTTVVVLVPNPYALFISPNLFS